MPSVLNNYLVIFDGNLTSHKSEVNVREIFDSALVKPFDKNSGRRFANNQLPKKHSRKNDPKLATAIWDK